MTFQRVAALDEVWPGEMRPLVVDGVRVLLVNTDDEVSAFLDCCAHQGVALSQGRLEAGVIVCAAHGWTYDARTGCGANPRSARLTRLPVRVDGGDIFVDVASAGAGAR